MEEVYHVTYSILPAPPLHSLFLFWQGQHLLLDLEIFQLAADR